MEWLVYLLEANLYLLAFYGFYCLLLKNQTFYNSNRFYLVATSILAFVIPILQVGYLKPKPITIDLTPVSLPVYSEESLNHIATEQTVTHFNLSTYLYPLYLIIALCFALKLTIGLIKICKLWLKAPRTSSGTVTIIELNDQTAAFSFFNLLFIHPKLADKQTVLQHEMVHIRQKHSFDILFFEMMQIICWFNPILYFIKKDIKLLHEYIADELTARNTGQKHEYAMFLIENSFGVVPHPLTNQFFNQSILKRRINMLNKKRTATWARLRLLLVLPLGGAMLCTSTLAFTKDYGYVDLLPEKSEPTNTNNLSNLGIKEVPVEIDTAKWKQGKPMQLKIATTFIPNLVRDEKTNKMRSVEQRYILINNKKVADLKAFYGVTNAQKIIRVSTQEAQKKYGAEAKKGAVEITGTAIKWLTINDLPLPLPPKVDQIKFPPPIVKPDNQTSFHPKHKYNKTLDQMVNVDKRYIIVNGEPISDNSTFHGVTETESVTYLSAAKAINVYGIEKGKNGAVEIKGTHLKYISEIKVPPPVEPPPPRAEQLRVAPPKKGEKSKYDNKKPIHLKLKPDAPVKEVQLNEDIVKLVEKLPALTVQDKETNSVKEIPKEDVAKLILKLPSVKVTDKGLVHESKSKQPVPIVKVVIDQKNN